MTTPDILPVLAVAGPDAHLAIKLLRWVRLLRGAVKPEDQYPLVVFHAKGLDEKAVEMLREAAGPGIIFTTPPEVYEYGYAPSANYQFRSALEMVEATYPGAAMLWLEADTVPMRPTWFAEIVAEYRACGRPFMGDFVPQRRGIDHMTGVAVYPPNWRELAPSLAILPQPRPHQGWDSMCAHEIVPQMARSKTIQQTWRPPPITPQWIARHVRPECALFHQCKDGTFIDALTEIAGETRIPLGAAFAPSSYPLTAPQVAHAPRVEILIVTFARDMEFLRYCLKSIRLYASGFHGVTIVVPSHEVGLYDWVRREARVVYFDEPAGKGMMAHEIQKCRADEWCPGADFILHLDADCMFFRRVTPADYVKDWQALIVGEPYASITNPNRHIWKKCVEDATGHTPKHDCMVRHPQVHPRQTYQATRDAVEAFTGRGFNEYVLSCRNEFPQGFAEYPTLATIGLRDFRLFYNFMEYDHAEDAKLTGQPAGSFQYAYRRDRDFLVEWWSHGGIARYKSDCDAVLAGRIPAYFVK